MGFWSHDASALCPWAGAGGGWVGWILSHSLPGKQPHSTGLRARGRGHSLLSNQAWSLFKYVKIKQLPTVFQLNDMLSAAWT